MRKNNKKLYTLKHNSVLDGVETIIPFTLKNGETKDKLTLTEIDAYTTLFEDNIDLMYRLNSLGYYFYNSHFFIEDNNGKQRKKEKLIYSNQHILRKFALDNLGEETVKCDITFHRYLYALTEEAKENPAMLKYLKENRYINSWLKQNIEDFIGYQNIDVEAAHIYMTRIKKELKKYKTIRNIEIGMQEYEKVKKFKKAKDEENKQLIKKVVAPKKPYYFIERQGQLFNPDNY